MNPDSAAPVELVERVSRSQAARVAAALGLDPAGVGGLIELPMGWHWAWCLGVHAKAGLAPDGLPADDPLLPQMAGFATRVMGGTTVTLHQAIPMEAELRCQTHIAGVVDKAGRSGPLRILTIERRYLCGDQLMLQEQQEVVYLNAAVKAAAPSDAAACVSPCEADEGYGARIDEIDVFRFSAVTFNAHRLHYDAAYARGVEGWPAILVQAKLLALHALEACRQAQGPLVRRFSFRSVAPLACPARIHVALSQDEPGLVQARVSSAAGLHLTASIQY